MKYRAFLRGNKKTERPRWHVFAAAHMVAVVNHEANDIYFHRLQVGTMLQRRADRILGGNELPACFETPDEFWQALSTMLHPKDTTWIWAERMLHFFGAVGGWNEIDEGRLSLKSLGDGEGVWFLRGSYQGYKLCFLDVHNWLRKSVGEVSEMMGDGLLESPQPEADASEWHEALVDEAFCWASAMMQTIYHVQAHDLGCLRFTIAAQALQAWRHRFGVPIPRALDPRNEAEGRGSLQDKLLWPLPHSCQDALDLERDSFHGLSPRLHRMGKVEGPIYDLDVQMMYPSIMRHNKYPVKLISKLETPGIAALRDALRCYGMVARVLVATDAYRYPCSLAGRIVYPIGTYWTVLAKPELTYALSAGHVVEVSDAYLYLEESCFADYMDHMIEWRMFAQQHDDKLAAYLAKSFGVSLYGKFGQRQSQWQLDKKHLPLKRWGKWPEVDADEDAVDWYRSIGGTVEKMVGEGEAKHSFPLIPSYVTSQARLFMWHLVETAGPAHVFYECADSMHVDEDGLASLREAGWVQQGKAGSLSIRHEWSEVDYFGPSRYVADGELCVAGLSKSARQVGPLEWEQDELPSTDWTVSACPPVGMYQKRRRLSLRRSDSVGVVDTSGRVHPYRIVVGSQGAMRVD